MGIVGNNKKLKAQLIRAGLEMSSWDSIIYFVVKRPYDSILTLILRKVNKNKRYVTIEECGDFLCNEKNQNGSSSSMSFSKSQFLSNPWKK